MKRWFRLSLALLLAALITTGAAASEFLPVFGSSTAPVQQRHSIALSPGQTPSFAPEDLERRLGLAADSLRAVTFTQLPDAAAGVLMLHDQPVLPYASITRRQLQHLVFAATGSGAASFTLLSDAGEAVTATLAYTSSHSPNSPPAVQSASLNTLQGVRRYSRFVGTDPDGDSLSYSLVTPPKRGQVTIVGDAFIYTPLPGAKGSDKFAFCAQDDKGNLSNTGVVSIAIERTRATPYFSDLQGSCYEYAAVKLADAGVLSGESFGQSRLFYPDQKVTGGQLVVMTLAALGLDRSLPPCVNTGLVADSEIPQWLKPYLSRALETGIISDKDFDPAAVPTRAQAVELIYRAAGLKPLERQNLRLQDVGKIPTAALPAYMTLTGHGLMEHYDGYSNPTAALDRGYAASLLWGLYSSRS